MVVVVVVVVVVGQSFLFGHGSPVCLLHDKFQI